LGEILLEKGFVTAERLKEALEIQQKTKEFLGNILLREKWIKGKDLLVALSEQFDIPLVSLKNKYINWNLVKEFGSSLILEYNCIPFQSDGSSITFAITNPLDAWVLKKAEEEAMGLKTKFVLVSKADMDEVIQRVKQYMRQDITKRFK